MMKSKLFIPETRKTIEQTVVALLNGNQLMNYNTVNSPRAVGDAVQGFLEKNISKCLPEELVAKINTSFARRMAYCSRILCVHIVGISCIV